MKKRVFAVLSMAVCLTLMCVSCNKGKDIGHGMTIRIHDEHKDARQVQTGDYVTMQIMYKTDKDSVILDSKNQNDPFVMPISGQEPEGTIYDALKMLHVGDSASLTIQADSFFVNTVHQEQVPTEIEALLGKKRMLYFEIKILDSKPHEEFEKEVMAKHQIKLDEEKAAIEEYVATNAITVAPQENGLYYIETLKGKGKKVEAEKTYKIHYTGKLLNGTEFDSSVKRDAPMTLTVGVGRVIPGFDAGLLQMNVGGKATLIIPSMMAYGPRDLGNIPPYSTLVFDVEVLEEVKAE